MKFLLAPWVLVRASLVNKRFGAPTKKQIEQKALRLCDAPLLCSCVCDAWCERVPTRVKPLALRCRDANGRNPCHVSWNFWRSSVPSVTILNSTIDSGAKASTDSQGVTASEYRQPLHVAGPRNPGQEGTHWKSMIWCQLFPIP